MNEAQLSLIQIIGSYKWRSLKYPIPKDDKTAVDVFEKMYFYLHNLIH